VASRRTVIAAVMSSGLASLVVGAIAAGRHASSGSPAKPAGRIPMVDMHVHLSPGGSTRLLGLMKRYGFDHVVNLSGGHPLGVLPDQLAEARASGGKITVFTGFPYEQAQAPGYGARMAKIVRMGHELGAKGLKIAKALGLGLPGPDGKLLPVDDPELDPVFEAAGELGMPIAIHSGDPRAFWLPVDAKNERYAELSAHPGWALSDRKVPSFDAILSQQERRIARHPKTTFISVHFGNCAEDVDRVASLMRRYPNMYIDTAARIPEMGRHPVEKLRAFFSEFQDRIVYGSDLGVGPEPEPLFLGSSGANPPTPEEQELFFSATHRFFETSDRHFAHPTPIQGSWTINGIALPREILEKVYFKNAMRLLGLTKI
jgi:predicted TIM-barrel fold metal-dependent hydrolase